MSRLPHACSMTALVAAGASWFVACGAHVDDDPLDASPSTGAATFETPVLTFTPRPDRRTPVTDHAGCIESLLTCAVGPGKLRGCVSDVTVCAADGSPARCCAAACVAALAARLDEGEPEYRLFLDVMVDDATCTPGMDEVSP